MNKRPIEQAQDADLRLSMAAMHRAAHRARELARQTGTFLVVSRGGVLELVEPNEPARDVSVIQEIRRPYGGKT